MKHKICRGCGKKKPLSDYGNTGGPAAPRPRARCRACDNEASRIWAAANREKTRASQKKSWAKNKTKYEAKKKAYRLEHLEEARAAANRRHYKQYHGITRDRFEQMHAEAGGKCAICGKVTRVGGGAGDDRAVLDHDHTSGAARGVICSPCNLGLGHFRDNPASLAAAITYLREASLRT